MKFLMYLVIGILFFLFIAPVAVAAIAPLLTIGLTIMFILWVIGIAKK